jgi:pSer/pThr/pTyr-binding forkhead associated (FHA) protein
MPKLLLKFNAAVIKEIKLGKEAVLVGRKPDNQIVIDNPAISSHHCKVTLEGGTYYIEDLDSTNGTYVNQKRVKKAGLHNNDVVGVAKHSLLFVDDTLPPEVPKTVKAEEPADKTAAISPEQQTELLAAAAPKGAAASKLGVLRILKGGTDQHEVELKGMSTYIGNSDRVQVRIKHSGFFGSAPEVAASIHRKPEGYVLVAVEAGYPVVNGKNVTGSILLKDGDFIDCGATTMQFVLKEAPKGA